MDAISLILLLAVVFCLVEDISIKWKFSQLVDFGETMCLESVHFSL